MFFDETDLNRGMFHLKPITFRMKKSLKFGVPLAECNVDKLAIPKLDDGDAVLFGSNEPYREIRMKILVCLLLPRPKSILTKVSIVARIL